jgi:3-hydroxyisobutyrate dehydrogenase-like beta-hydroxyacid dehydrogenase
MVNQILISTTMIGLVEGLLYAYKAGLNLEEVLAAVYDINEFHFFQIDILLNKK